MTDEEAYRVWEKARGELAARALEYRMARALAMEHARQIFEGQDGDDGD